ncbi:hypothetical protein BMF35_a2151 [Aurantiacibacter gangjinensis]|nr:hypothetical protein BMF35_a2151 [Aurantiacibacter gangjinensis]
MGTIGVHGDSFLFAGYGAKGARKARRRNASFTRALTGQARAFVKDGVRVGPLGRRHGEPARREKTHECKSIP